MEDEEIEVEHLYPLSGKVGHLNEENCPCHPTIEEDDFGFRIIQHYDFDHRTEKELTETAKWAFNAFLEIAINSTDRQVIDIAKLGIEKYKIFL